MKRLLVLVAMLTLTVGNTRAQSSVNTITTAAPFLSISPDARSTSMGNTGVATLPDANSQYWNLAKYAFCEPQAGISLSYAPWMTKITNDSYNAYLSGFYRLGKQQSLSASLTYFSYGDAITYKDDNNNTIGSSKPYEMAVDVAYSRLLGQYFSGGVAFRYIRSQIAENMGTTNTSDIQTGQAFAADVAFYYLRPISLFNEEFKLGVGVNLSNLGTKVSYSSGNESSFLPTNLRLGGMLAYDIQQKHRLALALDFNKLLVPTPPVYDANGNIVSGKDPNQSIVSAMFTSFADAPGGFSEEIKEITTSIGLEYSYLGLASLRCGYFEQSVEKGSSSFFSLGGGIIYKMVGLDVAYIVPTYNKSIFSNTFKLSLSVVF